MNIYLLAYQAAQPLFSLDEIMQEGEEIEPNQPLINMMPYSCRTPEQIAIERERWQNLREETKQVIELIVNCPSEIYSQITGRGKDQMTEKAVARYLRRQWGERLIVQEVIQEIKQFVRETVDDKIRG